MSDLEEYTHAGNCTNKEKALKIMARKKNKNTFDLSQGCLPFLQSHANTSVTHCLHFF